MRRISGKSLARLCALVGAVVLLNGCTGSATNASSASSAPTASSAAMHTGASSTPSHRCTATTVRLLVGRFVHAFNAGDQQTLQRLWPGADFAWYSNTDAPGRRIGAAAKDRATLGRYFASRHATVESLHLTSFKFNGDSPDGSGNFQFTLMRKADALQPTAYVGKGGAWCHRTPPALFVWSMGQDQRAEPSS